MYLTVVGRMEVADEAIALVRKNLIEGACPPEWNCKISANVSNPVPVPEEPPA